MEDCSNADTPIVAHHGSHADSGAACGLRAAAFDRWWDACNAFAASLDWRCELACGGDVYHPTETISVTLSNQSTQAISFPDHLTNCTMIQLQRQVQGNWENVHACLLLTATRLHRLDAGKRLVVALVSSAARPWAVGLYHATLRYRTIQTFGGLTTSIVSAGFQVVS